MLTSVKMMDIFFSTVYVPNISCDLVLYDFVFVFVLKLIYSYLMVFCSFGM